MRSSSRNNPPDSDAVMYLNGPLNFIPNIDSQMCKKFYKSLHTNINVRNWIKDKFNNKNKEIHEFN